MRFGRLSRMLAATFRSACSDISTDPSASDSCFWYLPIGASRRLAPRDIQLRHDLFLDVAQAVLAEKDLFADEEGRRAEGTARHRIAGVLDQLFLDVILLRARNKTIDLDARRNERLAKDLRIVHLLRLDPHVMVGRTEIALEHPLELRSDGAPHQRQCVYGKERVELELSDVVPPQEALRFQ